MNTQNHIISENLVISQPLYENDLAAQSIYDKYLRETSLIPISSIQEKETSERPFAGTRQNSQNQNPRNQHNIQEYNSLEPEIRNRPQQQQQQQRLHHRNLQQGQQDHHYQYEQQQYQRHHNIYYHQRQNNLNNNQYYNQQYLQYHHHQPNNLQNYRAEQEYYGQHIRRLEQDRRRKNRLPKYGLDQGEIAALSEINYRQSRAQCWDEENKKCSICISNFEENEKIRFLPCLHRFHSNCVDSWLQTKGSCPLCKKYVRCLVQQFQ